MGKPVRINPESLKLLFRPADASSCRVCGKKQAIWGYQESAQTSVMCSICILYETVWGKSHKDEISDLIEATKQLKPEEFDRSDDGRLLSSEDANAILGAIYLTNSMGSLSSMFDSLASIVKG